MDEMTIAVESTQEFEDHFEAVPGTFTGRGTPNRWTKSGFLCPVCESSARCVTTYNRKGQTSVTRFRRCNTCGLEFKTSQPPGGEEVLLPPDEEREPSPVEDRFWTLHWELYALAESGAGTKRQRTAMARVLRRVRKRLGIEVKGVMC